VLEDMIARSRAEVLVTDADGAADLPDLSQTAIRTVVIAGPPAPAGALLPAGVRVVAWDEVASSAPADAATNPAGIAGLMYTSGTTGRSKAVLLRHNHLCRGAGWVAWSVGLDERDVIHMWLPLFHIAGQLDATLAAVAGGSAIALYPTFSRSRFWRQVEESGATVFIGFSNVLEILFASDAPEGGATLRAGIAGGIPPKLHRPFEERFGVRLHDVYGMTEAEPMILPRPGEIVPPGSCGRPSPDFEVALLDPDGKPVARGRVGEIVCRPRVPDVMTPGYESDEAATLEATRDLWFHTGDLGREDRDGFLFFVDRDAHAIRRRGENVSSWELERIVAKHPAVAECCAVGVASPLGEDDVKVVVARADGQDVDPAELREWCTHRMAAFMVPRYVEVVDVLPKTPTAKIRKRDLRDAGVGRRTWDREAEGTRPAAQATRL
jgi:crotonobetaine/carnitine-CoA ligase